jgi:hypothetical protein
LIAPVHACRRSPSTGALRVGRVASSRALSPPRCPSGSTSPSRFARKQIGPGAGSGNGLRCGIDRGFVPGIDRGIGIRSRPPSYLLLQAVWPSTSRPQRRVCEVENQTSMDGGWG